MLTTEDGRTVQLGDEIGRGGEGIVYAVLRQPDVVAKLYQQAVPAWKADKLRAMVRLRNPNLESFAAWPTGLLMDGGAVRGFLMPRLPAGFKPIHQLYGPSSRRAEFPGARWNFLVHVAMNLCRAFASIHPFGHLVGDVNHDNIRVDVKGVVRLIDCDSFQICDGNRLFRSVAGVALYVAPELQNVNLATLDRTPQHERFGLAVVLFQLLMMGRHPYAGKYLGSGEMPIERAIKENRFVYGRSAVAALMQQPPFAVGLEVVIDEVRELFCLAFEAAPALTRPSPAGWLAALERQCASLVSCSINSSHIFSRSSTECPWCKVITAVGQDIFWRPSNPDPHQVAIILDELRGRLAAAEVPVPPPVIPVVDPTSFEQDVSVARALFFWQQERRLAAERWAAVTRDYQDQLRLYQARHAFGKRAVTGLKYAAGAAAVCGVLLPMDLITGTLLAHTDSFLLLCPLLFTGFSILVALHIEKEPPAPVEVLVPTPQIIEQARANLAKAEREFAELQQRIAALERGAGIHGALHRAQSPMKRLEELPLLRAARRQEMESQAKDRQRNAFLSRHRIQAATIPNIGPGRTATLRSYRVETAADVSAAAILRIPGFAASLTSDLMYWRAQIESRFTFNPLLTFTQADAAALEGEINLLRGELIGEVRKVLDLAERLRAEHVARVAELQAKLNKAAQALAQARAMAQGL